MRTDEEHAIELLGRLAYGRVASSLRALPFVAIARHIVVDGAILLRMHKGYGYDQGCIGSVVAYGADNAGQAADEDGLWSVQFVGACTSVTPTQAELELFGPAPHFVDGEPFEPVHLRIEPQFVTVHSIDDGFAHRLRNPE